MLSSDKSLANLKVVTDLGNVQGIGDNETNFAGINRVWIQDGK